MPGEAIVAGQFRGLHNGGENPRWPFAPAAAAFVAVSNFLHPPFSSRDDGGCPIGVEVELVEEAAARLGHRVEWQERPFSDLLAAVAAGKADVAVSTIGITEDRAQLVDFSAPYHRTDIVALVRIGEGEKYSSGSTSSLKMSVGISTSTTEPRPQAFDGATQALGRRS